MAPGWRRRRRHERRPGQQRDGAAPARGAGSPDRPAGPRRDLSGPRPAGAERAAHRGLQQHRRDQGRGQREAGRLWAARQERTSGRRTGGPIQLPSVPLTDDTVLRIRAIKIFDAALTRPPQTNLLAVRLPLFVRADPGLAVAADPGPIYDFQAARFARVGKAAAGVDYRAAL